MARKGAYKIVKLWGGVLEKSVTEHHIDGFKVTSKGHVSQVHHIAYGWMKAKDYYGLQKLHDTLPLLQEVVRGGYVLSAAIYAFNPSIASVTIPIGGTLLGAALLDVIQSFEERPLNPARLAKAVFKVAGPGGAIVQAIESLQAILHPEAVALGVIEAVFDPCNPNLAQLIGEFFNPTLRTAREIQCAEKRGLTP